MIFDWRIIPVIGAVALLAGFGIETYKPLSTETPVIIAPTGWLENSSTTIHVATLPCIADGVAAAGYVKDIAQLRASAGDIVLGSGAEVTTLSQAKSLIHDHPISHALDPYCVQNGYFEMRKSRLIWDLVNWH
jgi:hypothetical protein